ncbi:MAG: hypothetical protein DRQ55_18510, partial [Planctomycetota bacterium]
MALVLLAVGAVGASSGWTGFATAPEAWHESDFQILWAAGHGLAEGVDITDPAALDRVGARTGREATPFCAAQPLVTRLFGLSSDDFSAAYRAWLLLHALAGVLAVALLAGLLRDEGLTRAAALAVALAAVGLNDGLWMSLAMNSTNLVALAAVCAAAWAARRRRALSEGLALALAVLAKTSPLLLVLVAAWSGRVRAASVGLLGWVAATLTALVWLGSAPLMAWMQRTAPALGFAPAR